MHQIEIRIKGHINRDWSDWLSGIIVTHTRQGETVLTGSVRDQAALYGLLARLADLALQLNSIVSGPEIIEVGQRPAKEVPLIQLEHR
jgi:hypothetical protein